MVETAGVVGLKQETAAAESEVRDSTNSGRQALCDEWLQWGESGRSLAPDREFTGRAVLEHPRNARAFAASFSPMRRE